MNAARPEELKGEPKGYFVVVPPAGGAGETNLRDLVERLWRGKLWIAIGTVVFGALAVAHVIWTTPIYRSSAVLAVRTDNADPGSALRGQLGGLASIAGVGLGQAGARRTEFIAYLQSRALAKEFILSENLMPVMYASRWDPSTRQFRPGKAPAVGDGVDAFMRGIRNVSVEQLTGLITVSMEWDDPRLASRWTNDYVALANRRLREESISTAKQSIAYLNEELTHTTLEPVRQSLFRMLESRLNEQMLATVQREYAFKVIDPAEASEPRKFVRPRPVLETAIGLMAGFAFGVMFTLWRYPPGRRENTTS